ncbi:MAG: hypothetical protein KAS32_09380 [Candidatus Peribacteraceae bacterium]|nr:hypothetical protein [Candidatus Peribacteraceae bacterium]
MKDTAYLVLGVDGIKRLTKKPPKLNGDERSVAIVVNVADEVFDYTFMKAELTIEEDDVIEPTLDVQLLHVSKQI